MTSDSRIEPANAPSRLRRAELLSELVGINSVNPDHGGPKSGPGGEGELARWIGEQTDRLGAEVTLDEVLDGRPNVYCHFAGANSKRGNGPPRTICVDVHLDTVGVEHMPDDPFEGRLADERVYGRGSVDTKATFAVILEMLESLPSEGRELGPDLLLVGSISEEMGGFPGAYALQQRFADRDLPVDQIVVAEPTMCAPVYGHKGGLGLEVTVRGAAAHSSKPHLGQNAIVAASRVVAALQAEHERLIAGEAPTEVGTGTLAVTAIEGGLARNIIPDSCRIFGDRRVAPGEDVNSMFERLQGLVVDAASPLEVEVSMSYDRVMPGFFRPADSELVSELARLSGNAADIASYGTNALAYNDLDADIVIFGPGSIDQAHKAVEWVDVDQLDIAGSIYREWLTEHAG
ncbi:MAG: M20/M25/M40 family metallo-hydrolase [Acidimicrobiia bacterium]|nr:M20/M25/M40 family metallo-hydrolase [Acidimicrobiia bacterium]MDH5519001.1 M20/M25/M40 family metallo-hydrolase [Acidimicrobiia bacterium]